MIPRWFFRVVPIFLLVSSTPVAAVEFTRTEDVIYGRKVGMALTMDVFQPKKPNGTAIVLVVSGGWFSSKQAILSGEGFIGPFLERGYTVFAVLHGSQPKFTIPEMIGDMQRSIRFIRHHAIAHGIDPGRIGVTGGSAGGHLSLMLATQGGPGNPGSADPVDRADSSVQAVACLFPPTDFLNYGHLGEDGVGVGILQGFGAAFGDRAREPDERRKLGREISPVYHVTADLPPVLIIHGDEDLLVPLQQGERFVQKVREAGATARLEVREGRGHGWADIGPDLALMADWFDEHLRGQTPKQP